MDKKKIILVLGRTGSGKDSIVNYVAEKNNLNILKSYTTRPRRVDEGNTHIFVDDKFYFDNQDSVVAYTEINNYKYFCTKQQLEECDIYIIDPEGQKYLQTKCPDIELIAVYINLDYFTRKDRACNQRKDDEDIFESRNISENQQFTEYENNVGYNYLITNNNFEKSCLLFQDIIDKYIQ